jgi:hypothetical protein
MRLQRFLMTFLTAFLVAGGFAPNGRAEDRKPTAPGSQKTTALPVQQTNPGLDPEKIVTKESPERARGARKDSFREFRPSVRVPAGDAVSFPVDI